MGITPTILSLFTISLESDIAGPSKFSIMLTIFSALSSFPLWFIPW